MDSFGRAILMSTLPAVLAGLLTAYLSVRWALRRFRAERWFERKAQAYSDLFLALANIEHCCSLHLRQIEEGFRYDTEYLDRAGELSRAGLSEIRRAAAMGEFLFSPESTKRIQQLERDIQKAHVRKDVHDTVSDERAAASLALCDLRPLAKSDVAGRW